MKNNKKIIDKVCKCLRLSESGNPNEAAAALRQAAAMMEKYGISDAQILTANVTESVAEVGERYNPPFWALALATLIAEAFQCRSLISRRYGRGPEFRFIGVGYKTEIATYSYMVLVRSLQRAIEEFGQSLDDANVSEVSEVHRRKEVFVQAWLFRVGRTVSAFINETADKVVIDEYIQQKYGETAEFTSSPADTQHADYEDILSGMRAANEVELYRSVESFFKPEALEHRQAS